MDVSSDYGDLSSFWQSFILPLQNLSELTLYLYDVDLTINEWPPQLKDLSVGYDCSEHDYGIHDGVSCGKLVLHGISKSSLKCIMLYGKGDITLKDDPDGKDQIIFISYFGEDDTDLDDEMKSSLPEFFEKIYTVKLMIDGQWSCYRIEDNQSD
ncbi:unnamed protein product [Ambrosiozyma monospora]|uniref:Unnamed protein product n=1 Tax=Ambrosiozyma monospora TaxID=43982 RepID=A0ACB5TZF8_AMBMO|nr:unnamed protein product [Ambrosiozyma monospora]